MNGFTVELCSEHDHAVIERAFVASDGSFDLRHVTPGSYVVRLVAALGQDPVVSEIRELHPSTGPLVLMMPRGNDARPVFGIVSLHQLAHPIPKKAQRAFAESLKYRDTEDAPKAMAKLEEAVRIEPSFRDAHARLGA